MEIIDYETGPSKDYGGFWIRLLAYIIDCAIVQMAQMFVISPLLGYFGFTYGTFDEGDFDGMSGTEAAVFLAAFISVIGGIAILTTAIQILYFSLMNSSSRQATVGKMILGLKITDTDGRRINFGRALLREMAKILSGFLFMIGYIMAAFTEKKQALHDIIASTIVVSE